MGLQGFRDSKQSWLIYIVFALIIVVFIFMFGMPSNDMFGGASVGSIAKVNGHEIESDLMTSMILRHYDDRVFETDNYLPLVKHMSYNLALIYLLADDARANGLRVSDEEWNSYVTNWEAGNKDVLELGFLDKNNEFSSDRYQSGIRRFRMSSKAYRDYKENELLARKYLAVMQNSISVSDEAVWNMFVEHTRRADIEVIKLTPAAIKKTIVPVTPEDVDAYLSTNLADVQKFYDEHVGLYTTPEKLKLQQILIQTDYSKLTNVGAKTVKTLTSKERYTIAKHQVVDEHLDFAQAYADYDESQSKTENGIMETISVDQMAPEYAAIFDSVAVGEIATGELKDRYVIVKVLDRTPEIVTPLADVQRDIAQQLIENSRIQVKMDATSEALAALLSSGSTLQDAIDKALYSDILAEAKVVAPAPAPTEPASDAAPSAEADSVAEVEPLGDVAENPAAADAVAAAEPAAEAVPEPVDQNAIVVPLSERIHVLTLSSVKIGASALDVFMSAAAGNSAYSIMIDGIGESDELVRDIREAEIGTTLSKPYKVNDNIFFVRVTDKKEPDKAMFELQKASIADVMTQIKTFQLIGNIDEVLNLRTKPNTARGLWLEQRLKKAEVDKSFTIYESWFQEQIRERQRREKQREEQRKKDEE